MVTMETPHLAKIKLLVVIDEMEVGGTQRQVVQLVTHLDKERFQVELLYFRNTSFLVQQLEDNGIPTKYIVKKRKIDPVFLLRLVHFLKEGNYDLIHTFSLSAEFWIALANLLSLNRPQISSIRAKCEWYSNIHWLLKKWVIRRSSLMVSNSKAGADYVARRVNGDPNKYRIVPNGIWVRSLDPGFSRSEMRRTLMSSQEQPLGLFVGRLVQDKNLPSLIRAVEILIHNRVLLDVIIVGDGPMREQLQAQIGDAGLSEHVRIVGERSDVPEVIAAADFLILPSYEEGLSNVLMEAMYLECPVIASNVGGNPELIEDEQTGLLYESDNSMALAERIRELIASKDMASRLAKAGSRSMKTRFSIENMVGAMDEIYCSVLSSQ
jgi:glycosyltransferase involved in cell wall biosynthesis